jgi:hypothetical protein
MAVAADSEVGVGVGVEEGTGVCETGTIVDIVVGEE